MQKLVAAEPSGFPFLSIYLNAEPNEQGRDGFGIWLKKELSEQAKNYAEDSAEAQSFNADVERVTIFLENEVEPAANGIAIYAIHAFTKSLAQSLVEKGIRVNCVAPGPMWTPLNIADKAAKEAAKHGADTPMKRPGQPEEVAPAFVFFASNADSSYITGEVLTLLGSETRAA